MSDYITKIIRAQKPETTDALIKAIQQKYPLPKKEIINLLLQLENENVSYSKRIPKRKDSLPQQTFSKYILSSKGHWYWLSLTLTVITAIAILTITEDTYPLLYMRQILGSAFLLFLPGYVFFKTIFPAKVPIPTSSETFDRIEKIALSIVLSITLVALTGIFLNYTPWGIRTVPMTFSLTALTVLLATTGILREYQIVKVPNPLIEPVEIAIPAKKMPIEIPLNSAIASSIPDLSPPKAPSEQIETPPSKVLIARRIESLEADLKIEENLLIEDITKLNGMLTEKESKSKEYFVTLRKEIKKLELSLKEPES